jgi:hypothetical protein
MLTFFTKTTDSRGIYRSDGNGNPNYGREAVDLFSSKNQTLTRSWPLDFRCCFGQGIMWDASLDLDFGLALWRLHIMAIQVERPWEFMAIGLDFRLCPAQDSNSYIKLATIFSPFFRTPNKVWPLNPTASQLPRP